METEESPILFSPKEMMKSRRPHRFSDSPLSSEPQLSRAILEYHLDTLTSRNQETEFERFALAVSKSSICPNLRPQTGPAGGGDGKVDTETFPVAEGLTFSWYIGDEDASSANERWAFAFSAKRQWKGKLLSDIEKIASTKRGYTKAFFISNQLISDRNASEQQDALTEKYGMDVRILSRTWLLDQVFEKCLELVAIELLGIEINAQQTVKLGPNDSVRKEQLSEIDREIEEAVQQEKRTADLVNASLESARLARELELPKIEVEGRYVRAERLAGECGTAQQKLEVAYQQAWTAFFWHEDFDQFHSCYNKVEGIVQSTENPFHAERLSNLWHLAHTLERIEGGDSRGSDLHSKTKVLVEKLNQISDSPNRPNSALYARSLLWLQKTTETMPNTPASHFDEMRELLSQCDGLTGFPLDPLAESIQEMGSVFVDHPGYDNLLDDLIILISKNKGEVEAGLIILRRGGQKLEVEKYYEAISLIGRSLPDLAKYETREYLISGLNLLSNAYEQVGFYWAARGVLLSSISMIVETFEKSTDTRRLRSGPIPQLKWLELRLGRLSPCLEWAQFDRMVSEAFRHDIEDLEQTEDYVTLDMGLAILLLRANREQLVILRKLPDALDRLGFQCAKGALLCALGIDDDFYQAFAREGESPEDVYRKLASQPMAEQLSPILVVDADEKIELRSRVWGCLITISSPVSSPYIELAESILAAIEAALATAGQEGIVAASPAVDLNITPTDCQLFEFSGDQLSIDSACEICCGDLNAAGMNEDDQYRLRDKLCELVSNILLRVFMINDVEAAMEKLFGEERGFDRGVNLTTSFVTLNNILGNSRCYSIADWLNGEEKEYGNVRSEHWDAFEDLPKITESNDPRNDLDDTFAKDSWGGFGEINQQHLESVSHIHAPLWDSARWRGTAFMWDELGKSPPLLGLCFEDKVSASKIFERWHKELGKTDSKEQLRIVIVRGIMRSNPFAYRVCITSNIEAFGESFSGKYFTVVNRCNTMEPCDNENLNDFLERLKQCGCYGLIFGVLSNDGTALDPYVNSMILKRELIVREAWQIGVDDPDCMAISPNDHPSIPSDSSDVPVIKLIKWLKSNER